MSYPQKVFVLVLAGSERAALSLAERQYPGRETVIVSKTELRESNWKGQLRQLRTLKGEAFLIFTDSLAAVHEPLLMKWTTALHGCRETVLADSTGAYEVTTKVSLLTLAPRTVFAVLADTLTLATTWLTLQFLRWRCRRSRVEGLPAGQVEMAFLHPSPGALNVPGGALTHITGFLSGVAREGARAVVLAGQHLNTSCPVYPIPGSHRLYLLREAAALAYNLRFAAGARRLLETNPPSLLYQRHGRFQFAGAMLSQWLEIPLVLEYNGSEVWIARHWDPSRCLPWLRLAERVSIEAASLIVVVSKALKKELEDTGVPAERILINPNAVDPEVFQPGCGGAEMRQRLGFSTQDIVVGFVGTFSYWHGVGVLEQAARELLQTSPVSAARPLWPPPPSTARSATKAIKFLLVGDGLLAPQLRSSLDPYVRQGSVVFTGIVPHHAVRTYLDAANILVSPHVPMPDGTPFFGSPTKLFEYMAMGKPIVASALDQIADVLEDGRTALLVKPGDPVELAGAIQRLASDAALRQKLGPNARCTALARHTWQQNARRVLCHFGEKRRVDDTPEPVPVGAAAVSFH